MSYTRELTALLSPLGVYTFREGSFSMAELQALGAALEEARTQLERGLRESLVMTAQEEGLSNREALLRHAPIADSAEQRRAMIAGFWQISGDGFTLDALNRCAAACGAACAIEECGEVNRIRVRFPHIMGIPAAFARMRAILEDILPAHAEIEYAFRWCKWGETEHYGLLWRDLNPMSWHEWRVYHEGAA